MSANANELYVSDENNEKNVYEYNNETESLKKSMSTCYGIIF